MKSKNLILSALLTLCVAASASAQVSVGLGDLVLGFKKGSGTGSTSTVEVTLGSVTNFKAGGSFATGSEVFLSQLAASDLNTTYGSTFGSSSWKSSVTSWAVVGTNGAGGGNTLWATQAAAVPEAPGSGQGLGANTIAAVYQGLNGHAVAGTSSSAVLSTADSNNFVSLSAANFSYFASTNFRTDSALGSSSAVTPGGIAMINLYEYVEGGVAATLLGTFKLYGDNGNFSFTSVAAIPEPSTYAALLGVATLGIVAFRRRRQALLEV